MCTCAPLPNIQTLPEKTTYGFMRNPAQTYMVLLWSRAVGSVFLPGVLSGRSSALSGNGDFKRCDKALALTFLDFGEFAWSEALHVQFQGFFGVGNCVVDEVALRGHVHVGTPCGAGGGFFKQYDQEFSFLVCHFKQVLGWVQFWVVRRLCVFRRCCSAWRRTAAARCLLL